VKYKWQTYLYLDPRTHEPEVSTFADDMAGKQSPIPSTDLKFVPCDEPFRSKPGLGFRV
jgi:hypothetical protein